MHTRRIFLRNSALAMVGVGTVLGGPPKGRHQVLNQHVPQSANIAATDRSARVARIIEEYDRQGIHRTATDTDHRSAGWLAEQASLAGAAVHLEPFAIGRVDIRAAYVEAEGRRAEGLPLFDGTFTDARGVTGRLGPPETNADIALVVVDAAGFWPVRPQSVLRRSTKHRGIIAVTEGAHPGLSAANAGAFATPYGVPVLQVSSEDHLWLRDLTARGIEIRFLADATRTPTEASNIVATVAGRQPQLAPIIVMTPRSGWWHCASERGGGIACWLEAIRAVSAARPPRTLIGVASSGHELGHFGLVAFIGKRPSLIKNAVAWIHLGANIGAAQGRPRLQASDDGIEKLAGDALTRAGIEVQERVPRGTRAGGEARLIHDGGGRYVSQVGSGISTYRNPFFHNIADRWPAAVDVQAVSRFAQAFADLAVTLAS